MIEKDPTFLEAEVFETLKEGNIYSNPFLWTALENKKLLEAYELWGWDYCAIS